MKCTRCKTWRFGLWALLILLGGLVWSSTFEVNAEIFSSFMWGVVVITAAVTGKNGVDALAHGAGIKGVVSRFMTDEKPESLDNSDAKTPESK